jgi:hypothetical protein
MKKYMRPGDITHREIIVNVSSFVGRLKLANIKDIYLNKKSKEKSQIIPSGYICPVKVIIYKRSLILMRNSNKLENKRYLYFS